MQQAELARELASFHAASFGWALACCNRDGSQAADVLQQSYWKVLEGKARFEARSSLKTWFFGVIRMTAMENRRSVLRFFRRGESEANDVTETPASSSNAPDRSAIRKEAASSLACALPKLAPRQHEVLHLVFYEELTIAEAAVIMGVSLGSARQHYDRGKKKLHDLLT
jgi:RNA polymerase sigma factor (sigma-70 family)